MSSLPRISQENDILSNYPFPIAFEYALLRDMIEANSTVDDLCQRIRTVMWFSSRYLGVLVLSSYLKTETPDLELDDQNPNSEQQEIEIVARRKRIHDLLQVAIQHEQGTPSTSKQSRELSRWLEIIFEIAEFMKFTKSVPFIPEIIDWVSSFRNDAMGLSYLYDYYRTLPSRGTENLRDYFRDAYDCTVKFLSAIEFVKKYPLVKVTECCQIQSTPGGHGTYTWTARFLMGRKIEGDLRSIDANYICPEHLVQVLSVADTGSRFSPKLLPLPPLSVFAAYPAVQVESEESRHMAILDDSAEKGLRYRLVSLNRSVTPIHVTLQQYVDLLGELLNQSLKPKLSFLTPDAGWDDVRRFVNRQNSENRNRIGGGKYQEAQYLERDIDGELRDFLSSSQGGMLIVGDAGVGKTNLLCHWSSLLESDGETIVLLHDCRDFHAIDMNRSHVEQRLARDLGVRSNGKNDFPFQTVLEKLGAKRPTTGNARLVLLFDALNEQPEAHRLLEIIAGNIVHKNMSSWLKVVVTCRNEPWQRSLKYRFPSSSQVLFYKFGDQGEPIQLSQFSAQEAKEAYNEKYKLKPEFSTLPTQLQNLLTDPLMLGLAFRVYSESGLPTDLHQNRLLREYIHSLMPDTEDGSSKEQRFLTELLNLMHKNRTTSLTLSDAQQNPVLQEAFGSKWLTPSNPYLQLVSDLLRNSGDGKGVTFRYERVFEFALAEYVLRSEAEAQNWSIKWFAQQIEDSSEYPTLWGAIRCLMIEYVGEIEKCSYETIREFASYDLYEVGKLLAEALVALSARPEFSHSISRAVDELILAPAKPVASGTRMGEVAVTVAQRLGWTDVFELGARSPLVSVRIASIQAIYYVWRRRKNEGVDLITRIAHLVRREIVSSPPRAIINYVETHLQKQATPNSLSMQQLMPLTSSLTSLSMMMVSHCLREPETARDLYRAWKPIFDFVPRPMEGLFEILLRSVGSQLLMRSQGGEAEQPVSGTKGQRRGVEGIMTVRAAKNFTDQPLEHPIRLKAIHFLQECDPNKGRLSPIIEEVVELAKIPDFIIHYVVQILFLTRGHQSEEDVLEICQRLCETGVPYDQYEGTTKMGVYLYSVDHPPKTHMQFMRDQVLKIWEGSPKLFRLGNDSHVLDQLRYPIMYECSPLGENRSRGQVEFVRQVRESPWIGRVVDREVALIRALGEAAVFGHITYNTHVIPMLETLQEWFDPAFYGAQAPRGNLYPYTVSEALAAALSRIRSIYPDEVERYLGLAPAHLREMVDREREVSAGANVFMGGQASLPWLFKNPEFRQAWVRALTKIASEATDMERSFQILAAETFRFKLLRTILTG